MDMLMQSAKQFNVTLKVKPIAEEVLYQHKESDFFKLQCIVIFKYGNISTMKYE
jgi:hypothetical protein